MDIVEKQTEIIDVNPIVYHGSEELPITDDDISTGQVKYIGRGISSLMKYTEKSDYQKTEDPKVSISIKIPLSYANRLRATGRGWQTRMSDYLIKGLKCGALDEMIT